MRSHGTLVRWNEDRGFGFVRPAQGLEDIFVHISAFPRDGTRPSIDETLSFEVERGPDGRKRAIRVMRPGSRTSARTPARPMHAPAAPPRIRESRFFRTAFALLLAVAAGILGFMAYQSFIRAPEASVATLAAPPPPTPEFRCDGREHCSQMRSYEEAVFFLEHCPNTKMDGDRDGEPCEQQFSRW
jgi:cold shock CspA family protein